MYPVNSKTWWTGIGSLTHSMTANGSALLRYAMIISVQKLTQMIKSKTAGFLRMQEHNRKILKRILKGPLK